MQDFKSVMFVPGSNEKMLGKATELNADLILFDLEDSVLPENKQAARTLVGTKLSELKKSNNECVKDKMFGVRVNELVSQEMFIDLEAVLPSRPDVIVVPKLETADDLVKIDAMLAGLEAQFELPAASTKLIPLTAESPKAMFEFGGLKNVSNRVIGLTWGAEDLSNAIGAENGRDDNGVWIPPLQLAQSLCLLKAKDLGLQAIDTVYPDIKNLDGLRAECETVKALGFTGKLAIHPAQLQVINDVFGSSAQDIEQAQRIVKLFSDNPNQGALKMDGKMVDIPHLRAAERLLQKNGVNLK